jgi:hypothetical protein
VRRFGVPGAPLQVSTEGGRNPRWSAGDRELLYLNAKREIVAVPINGGTSFSMGTPRVRYRLDERSIWGGDLTTTDELIVIRRRLEAPGQVILIKNFDRLLKEKVGR